MELSKLEFVKEKNTDGIEKKIDKLTVCKVILVSSSATNRIKRRTITTTSWKTLIMSSMRKTKHLAKLFRR